MYGNSGNIHFYGGGRQPSLQPLLEEGKHSSDRACPGVFPVRRAPFNKQVPLQGIGCLVEGALAEVMVSTTA